MQWPERAAATLRRLVRELGLLGVEINTTLGPERFLDDPALDPFWAEAEALGALIMIHPSLGGTEKRFDRYYLNNLIHNPLETTVGRSASDFRRRPGALPRTEDMPGAWRRAAPVQSRAGCSAAAWSGRKRKFPCAAASRIPTVASSSIPSPTRFRPCASSCRRSAPEHVLLGSDYPFDMADPDLVGTVRASRFEPAEEALILRGNAERLLQAG